MSKIAFVEFANKILLKGTASSRVLASQGFDIKHDGDGVTLSWLDASKRVKRSIFVPDDNISYVSFEDEPVEAPKPEKSEGKK